jgi:hypothetical protein
MPIAPVEITTQEVYMALIGGTSGDDVLSSAESGDILNGFDGNDVLRTSNANGGLLSNLNVTNR